MLSVSLKRSAEEALAVLRAKDEAEVVADALEINLGQLLYILYKKTDPDKYRKFEIPKKSGGSRIICAPNKSINIIQRKLLYILSPCYSPPKWVHGFVRGRGIVTNSQNHCKKRFVINLDIADFYGSINFGRVRGVLQCKPYKLHPKVATILAHALTYENKLPQGACTSPLVANLVSWELDQSMLALAKKYKFDYSRYADDITISTTHPSISNNIAHWPGVNPVTGSPMAGRDLLRALAKSGFSLNGKKYRIQTRDVRQEVTGITVNEFPNVTRNFIRNTRALIHGWKVKGLLRAESEHITQYAKKPPSISPEKRDGTYFRHVIYGRLSYIRQVRGEEDVIYLRLCGDVAVLDHNPPKFILIFPPKS